VNFSNRVSLSNIGTLFNAIACVVLYSCFDKAIYENNLPRELRMSSECFTLSPIAEKNKTASKICIC